MFDNVGYQFASLEDLLMFVEWVTSTFENPEDFEAFLVDRMPFLSETEDHTAAIVMIDGCDIMDEYEDDQDVDEIMETDVSFWDIIKNEYHHKDDNDSTIHGSNRLEE